MTAASPQVSVSNADRVGLTAFLALAVHAVIIFGVSFGLDKAAPPKSLPTLEVTLVHTRSSEEPDEAEYLAQANQKGGGNVEEKVRPSSPVSNPQPSEEEGIAPDSRPEIAPPPAPEHPPEKEVLTAKKAEPKAPSTPEAEPTPPSDSPNAAQLFERSREMARLSAQIRESREAYAQRPRRTFVSGANAREFRFAAYMEAWRAKVERIGNINYPEKAKQAGLSGTLLLEVAIGRSGDVRSVKVLRSSGHNELDDAAVRIVHMAAPYGPLTSEITADTDVLHIVRTWQFRSRGDLVTKPGG